MCKRRLWLALGAFLLLVSAALGWRLWRVAEVSGLVLEGGLPLAGATVRVKATGFETISDPEGRFRLTGFPPAFGVRITAWAEGYRIAGASAWPWNRDIALSLKSYPVGDQSDYAWVEPVVEDRPWFEDLWTRAAVALTARLGFPPALKPVAERLRLGCADCHAALFAQWEKSSHARSLTNVRFLTMYDGTDVEGNQSPPTRYGFHRDYGRFPLRPDLSQPYYGPGFKPDFPDSAGNCAACHAPAAALTDPYGTNPNTVRGVTAAGVFCDFCHKIVDVKSDPATGLPFENMPGILSIKLNRPPPGPLLLFGPFDDVDAPAETFSPLHRTSDICAPCHNASFWGTPIYQSYAEWLASPYPQEGKTCQSCHMKPDGVTTNFAPGRGGIKRDPKKIFTHNFSGAADVKLLQNTAKLELHARQEGDRLLLKVEVTNENAGHYIPTDHPMRHILLLVRATDALGNALPYLAGPVIPDWGGVGTGPDDYAGRPGKVYAKVLEELWTEVFPTAAYWRQTVLREDTRLPAKATDITHYEFRAPRNGPVTVEARLIFRRAFKELAKLKKWDLRDIEMERETIILP